MSTPLDSSELQFVGHAQLHRILLREEYSNLLFKSDNTNTLKVFVYLLLKANWSDSSIVKKDEVMITEETLEKDLKLTRSKIRTAIKHLCDLKIISTEVHKFCNGSYTNKCTIYKFHNYHKKTLLIKPVKQSNEQGFEQGFSQALNKPYTSIEQALALSYKEYKEEKENKEDKTAAAGAAAKFINRKKRKPERQPEELLDSKSKVEVKPETIVEKVIEDIDIFSLELATGTLKKENELKYNRYEMNSKFEELKNNYNIGKKYLEENNRLKELVTYSWLDN